MTDNDQRAYWNEDGGERWVASIDRVEGMLDEVSAILLERVAATPGENILDIGCGGGKTSAAVAQAVGDSGSVLGVDVSAVILEVARKRFAGQDNLRFELSDAAVYDFEPSSIDVIMSRFGVMFFHEPAAAFKNIRKALRDDARLCFLCWRALEENLWMGVPAKAAFSVLPPPEKPEPGAPGPFAFADPERVRSILSEAGFTDIGFEALDRNMNLGTVDEATDWLTKMGPAAQPIREAEPAQREAGIAAMREALAANLGPNGVELPGATWIVTARAG